MDKALLQRLSGVRGLTLDQLRAKDPALAAQVAGLATNNNNARLRTATRDLSPELRATLRGIDFPRATGAPIAWLRAQLTAARVPPPQIAEVVRRAKSAQIGATPAALEADPVLAQHFAAARVLDLGTVA